eukprot:1069900-Prymnesium_polylepis.2
MGGTFTFLLTFHSIGSAAAPCSSKTEANGTADATHLFCVSTSTSLVLTRQAKNSISVALGTPGFGSYQALLVL